MRRCERPELAFGLAVCKRLVTAQSGTIWARNRPEGGAEFGFSLPGKQRNIVERRAGAQRHAPPLRERLPEPLTMRHLA